MIRRVFRGLVGATLWLIAGWDFKTLYQSSLPAWAFAPIIFYLIAGSILIIDGVVD